MMSKVQAVRAQDDTVEYITELRESTNETARVARNNLLVFLLVGLYMALLTGESDDLLFATGGRLAIPLMEIGLPVAAFYAVAPWLFLALHLNLFLRFGRLADVATSLQRKIERLRPGNKRATETELIFPLDFLQLLLHRSRTPQKQGESFSPSTARFLSRRLQHRGTILPLLVIVSAPLFIFPLILLGWMHWQFLRYQSEAITLAHQIVITLDVLLQMGFLLKLKRARRTQRRTPSKAATAAGAARYLIHSLVALTYGAGLVLTWWVAVVPGSWVEEHRPFADEATRVTKKVFKDWWGPENCGQRKYPEATTLRRYLHLPRTTIASQERPQALIAGYIAIGQDPTQAWQFIDELDIRNRSFRYARFENTSFWGVDTTESDFTCARLNHATMRKSRLIDVTLDHTVLRGANLQGSDLEKAHGIDTDFDNANLRDTHLRHAAFRQGEFHDTQFDGAHGASVKFIASDLLRAQFNGVDLYSIDFIGSDIRLTSFNHSDLENAKFIGSYLRKVTFHFSDLSRTRFNTTSLHRPQFFGTGLRGARFIATNAVGMPIYASDATNLRFDFSDVRDLAWSKPSAWLRIAKTMRQSEPPQGKAQEDWIERREDRLKNAEEDYHSRDLDDPKELHCTWTDGTTTPLISIPPPGTECLAKWEAHQRDLLCGKLGPSVRGMVAKQHVAIRSNREAYLAMALLERQPRPCENITAEERKDVCEALTGWFNDRDDDPSRLTYTRVTKDAADKRWDGVTARKVCGAPESDTQGKG